MQEPMRETVPLPPGVPDRQKKVGEIFTTVLLGFAVVLLVGVLFINLFIAPRFKGIFEDFGAQLPAATQFMIHLSDFVKQFWLLVIPLAAFVVVLAGLVTWKVDWRGGLAATLLLGVLCAAYIVGAVFCLMFPIAQIMRDARPSP